MNKMFDPGRILVILCLLFINDAYTFNLVQINSSVSVEYNEVMKQYYLKMDESNTPINSQLFQIDDPKITTVSVHFILGSFVYNYDNATQIFSVNNNAFDFEQREKYGFSLNDNSATVVLNLNNVDDELPSLSTTPCELEENTIYDKSNTTCIFDLNDADKIWNNMEFKIGDSEDEFFKIILGDDCTVSNSKCTALLTVIKTLDYETKTAHIFSVDVIDSGGNQCTAKVVVNVKDVADTPPKWLKQLVSEQFDEKSEQEFGISAQDGDYQINNDIKFNVIDTNTVCDKGPCVKLKDDTQYNTNTVIVAKIDRDGPPEISTYKFSINACEMSGGQLTDDCTPTDVTFFINDIDDNLPLITLTADDVDDTPVTCPNNVRCWNLKQDLKDLSIDICENFNGQLPFTIGIKDIDMGENAQFEVQLEDNEDANSVFQLMPASGYRDGTFKISVINYTYLDYETPERRTITFTIKSIENIDETKTDTTSITLNLINYNDEIPTFNSTSFSKTIKETTPIDTEVISIEAVDRDEEDAGKLKYEIIGTYAISVFKIDNNGVVTVKAPLDYDIINSIVFQVKATDTADNSGTTQVTINLEDVNNKAPQLTVDTLEPVEENLDKDYLVAELTATDSDTTAKLTAEIVWDKSTARKNYQNVDLTDAIKFVDLKMSGEDSGKLNLKLVVNNDNKNTPDYETFDTLTVNLKVTDLNADSEFMDKAETIANIAISIMDINDNIPVFTDATLTNNYTVSQGATVVGTITATDADVGTKINYSINVLEDSKKYDWITVEELTGILKVKEDSKIDPDTDQIFLINYTITAVDPNPDHKDEKNISIYVIDTNDKTPQITRDNFEIKEEISGILDEKITTTDGDRDAWYKTVKCEIKDTSKDCYDNFEIVFDYDTNSNTIKIKDGARLDRDEGIPNFDCALRCSDNPKKINSDLQLTNETVSFKITLIDINDNPPVIDIVEYSKTENTKKGDVIFQIIATDKDEGENSYVSFELEGAVNDETQEDATELFELSNNDVKKRTVDVVAKKELKDHYGEYTLTIVADNTGEEKNPSKTDLKLTIDKYNYNSPRFVYPAPNEFITLKPIQEQEEGTVLKKLNGEEVQNIVASYLPEENCSDKWDIKFTITDGNVDNNLNIYQNPSDPDFGPCVGQLQLLNRNQKEDDKYYYLTITATTQSGRDPDDGEPPFTSTTKMTLRFSKVDDPYFKNNTPITVSVKEYELPSIPWQLEEKATFGSPDIDEEIFYLFVGEDDIREYVTIESKGGNYSLTKSVDYLDYQNLTFSIGASKSAHEMGNNPQSQIDVTIEVIDINNHAPTFDKSLYLGAIIASYPREVITTLSATDLDTVCDKLSYKIDYDSMKAEGENLPTDKTFVLASATEPSIKQSVTVQANMKGYYQFDCIVSDEAGCGSESKSSKTSVKILVIIDENVVAFRFSNSLDDVIAKEDKMQSIITEVLDYQCDKIRVESEGNDETSATNIKLYFIENNEAVNSSTIMKLINQNEVYLKLKAALLNEGLDLLAFSSTTPDDNTAAILRNWLIGVSVFMTIIFLTLLGLFLWRTRILKGRISRLTSNKFGSQESNLNRLHIPNANEYAIEGANPIYNTETEKEAVDRNSINSGDSDLIGIEDSADFDMEGLEETSEYI